MSIHDDTDFPTKKLVWPFKKMAKDLQTIEPVAAFNMIKSSPNY